MYTLQSRGKTNFSYHLDLDVETNSKECWEEEFDLYSNEHRVEGFGFYISVGSELELEEKVNLLNTITFPNVKIER